MNALKNILIVGASRGLGLGLVTAYLARGAHVTATVRNLNSIPLTQLQEQYGTQKLKLEHVDIAQDQSLATFASKMKNLSFDLLFINAGVIDNPKQTSGDISTEEFTHLFLTNTLGPMRLLAKLGGQVPSHGAIVVMTSLLGSISYPHDGQYEVYGATKAALNRMLRSYDARSTGPGKPTLLAMHPGWVRTDMGGPQAPLDVATSVRGMLDTIDKRLGQKGLSFVNYKNEILPW